MHIKIQKKYLKIKSAAFLLPAIIFVGVLMGDAYFFRAVFAAEESSTEISAKIPFQPPPDAPKIVIPTNGQQLTGSPIIVSGTCRSDLTVVIYRNNIIAGSTLCVSNKFVLQIDLVLGANVLSAIQYNQAQKPSPHSEKVTVYLNQASSAVPVGEKLLIIADSSHKKANINEEISWKIEILGGTKPYSVVWDWGDGKIDKFSTDGRKKITRTHKYSKEKNYKVVIRAIDRNNNQAYIELSAIILSDKDSLLQRIVPADNKGVIELAWIVYFGVFLFAFTFWLGERFEYRILTMGRRRKK